MEPEFVINIPELNCFCIVYRCGVPADQIEDIKNCLIDDCTERYSITVFNNQTLAPRTNCFYADDGINGMKYSSTVIPAIPWKPPIQRLRDLVCRENFIPDSCLVNGYLNPKDKIGEHRDHKTDGVHNIVCTVSFGGSRFIKFRPYKPEWEKLSIPIPDPMEIKLNECDIVYMYGNMNVFFTHEILNVRKKDNIVFEPRYSATFRVIKDSNYQYK